METTSDNQEIMNSQVLTFNNLIQAKIGSFLNGLVSSVSPKTDIPGFVFDSYASESSSRKTGFVGFYRKSGKKIFVKKHEYNFKDMEHLYILNEASVLRKLKTSLGNRFKLNSGVIVNLGNYIDFKDTGKSIYVATAFEKGEMVKNLSDDEKISVLNSCITTIWNLYEKFPKQIKNSFSKRGMFSYMLSFLGLEIKMLFKDPKHFRLVMESLFIFYFNFSLSLKEKSVMSLSHRDLSKENMLYNRNKKTATVIDWENALVTDRLYDIATLPWLYSGVISDNKLNTFLLNKLPTISSRRRFVSFAIYHAIQCLSIYDKKGSYYKKVLNHLLKFKKNSAKVFLLKNDYGKKTLYEYVNLTTLTFISYILEILPWINFLRKESLILCYHSVSDSGWRFSTPRKDFEQQIEYILKHSSVISIDELMNGEKGVVISFDDGYKDVFKNAYPILKKKKLTATIFLLGNTENANRSELDNELEFMARDEIEILKNSGWDIGSHTLTHSDLFSLSKKELDSEILSSKKKLEEKLNVNVNYFAYPKGKYNSQIVDAVSRAGYDAAYTVDSGFLSFKNKMLIARIPMEGNIDIAQFSGLLTYPGVVVSNFFIILLKAKEKCVGLLKKGNENE